jgi:hypothetical protein
MSGKRKIHEFVSNRRKSMLKLKTEYVRKGKSIFKYNTEGKFKLMKTFHSINAAKRESFKLQEGKLGQGIVVKG